MNELWGNRAMWFHVSASYDRYNKRCQQLFLKQAVTQNLSVTEY